MRCDHWSALHNEAANMPCRNDVISVATETTCVVVLRPAHDQNWRKKNGSANCNKTAKQKLCSWSLADFSASHCGFLICPFALLDDWFPFCVKVQIFCLIKMPARKKVPLKTAKVELVAMLAKIAQDSCRQHSGVAWCVWSLFVEHLSILNELS